LDSKVLLVGNTYCNDRANGDEDVTSRARSGAYVWWPRTGGRLITPLLGFRRPDFGTRFAEIASEWKSQQRFCAFAAAPVH
jgi:hypothetical protein